MSPDKSETDSLATPNRQMTSEIETLPSSMSGNETTCINNHEVQQEKFECVGSPMLENTYRTCSDDTSSSPKKDPEMVNVARDCLTNCQSCAEQVQAEAITALELPGTGHFGQSLDAATMELRVARVETLEKDSNSHLYFKEAANVYTGNSDFVVSPKVNALKDDHIDQTKDAVVSFESMGACDAVNLADTSEDPLIIQEASAARFVSTNLEGWHRFDSEKSGVNGVLGFHQAIYGAPQKQLELWEQLLEDDGLEDSAQHTPMTIEQGKAEAIIEPSITDGNQFWLASPGNPFIEGLPRSSNFSETDGFITEANSERSYSLDTHVVDVLADTGLNLSDKACKKLHSGTRSSEDKSAEEIMGSHANGMRTDGGKKVNQHRFPSFSDLRRSSSRPRDSSFPSFKEQEPLNPSLGYENGGEKWEAIFDSVEPAIQEGPRSLSFPREANDSQNQASFEDLGMSHSKLSTFLASPKLSPIVKKVASKVRTNQSKVKNVVYDTKPSKDSDKKNSRILTWRCCICCMHQS